MIRLTAATPAPVPTSVTRIATHLKRTTAATTRRQSITHGSTTLYGCPTAASPPGSGSRRGSAPRGNSDDEDGGVDIGRVGSPQT